MNSPLKIYSLLLLCLVIATILLGNEPKGVLMFEDKFDKGLENWTVEKIKNAEGHVEVSEGKMKCSTVMDKENNLGTDGIMIWLKTVELPKNFKFEYDLTPTSDANDDGFFLLFFCYKHKEGKDLLDSEFIGKVNDQTLFQKYVKGPFDGYHISYRRGDAANCNLRKNSGMELLHQNNLKKVLPANKKVHITLTKIGGHIQLTIDDTVFMDFKDDGTKNGSIREGGRIGFRQVYKSSALYENVKLFKLPD